MTGISPLARRALLPDRTRSPLLVLAAWTAVAALAAVQTVAMARLGGVTQLTAALVSRLSIIPLWAIATPAILRSARRFPVVGRARGLSLPNVALHAAFGSAFIVCSNLAIRLPGLLRVGESGLPHFLESTARGLAEFYPAAILVYAIIVALGHAGARPAVPPSRPRDSVPLDDECLTVQQWNRVHLVRTAEIDWIGAEANYVVVHAAGKRYKARERMSDVESRLDPRRFVRIHRSAIVQVARIREVQPLSHGDHAVILRDGKVLRVARSRRDALASALAIEL